MQADCQIQVSLVHRKPAAENEAAPSKAFTLFKKINKKWLARPLLLSQWVNSGRLAFYAGRMGSGDGREQDDN